VVSAPPAKEGEDDGEQEDTAANEESADHLAPCESQTGDGSVGVGRDVSSSLRYFLRRACDCRSGRCSISRRDSRIADGGRGVDGGEGGRAALPPSVASYRHKIYT
jgi:hypothetical protein